MQEIGESRKSEKNRKLGNLDIRKIRISEKMYQVGKRRSQKKQEVTKLGNQKKQEI